MATPLIMLGPGGDYVSRYFVKGTSLAKQVGRSASTQSDGESASGFSDWQERHGAKSNEDSFLDSAAQPRLMDGFEHVEPAAAVATYRRAVGVGRPAAAMARIAAVARRVVAQQRRTSLADAGLDAATSAASGAPASRQQSVDRPAAPVIAGEPSIAVLAVAEEFLAAQQRVIQTVAAASAVDSRLTGRKPADLPHYALPDPAGSPGGSDSAGRRYVSPQWTACGAGLIGLTPAEAMNVASTCREALTGPQSAAMLDEWLPADGMSPAFATTEHTTLPTDTHLTANHDFADADAMPLSVASLMESHHEHTESDAEAVTNPHPHPRRAHRQGLFADDAGIGGQAQRLQGHRVRARGGAHQKGRAGARSAQGSLFNS